MRRLRYILLGAMALALSACVSISGPSPLQAVSHHQGDPVEKVAGFLLVFGIPIALCVDCVLLIVYGASLGEVGEPMMVTEYVIEVINNLTGGQ